MNDCLFCKIIAGEIPSNKVFENEYCYAFRDINPQAPVHILLVSKVHTRNLFEATQNQLDAVIECMKAIPIIVKQENLEESGFRVVTNSGHNACQTVKHLHFHILGGTKLIDRMA